MEFVELKKVVGLDEEWDEDGDDKRDDDYRPSYDKMCSDELVARLFDHRFRDETAVDEDIKKAVPMEVVKKKILIIFRQASSLNQRR